MPEKLLPWVLLFTAILFEVAGITSMKLSRGFSEPLPSLAVPVFYVFSALAVILALKRLELSMAYAIWSGVGTALAAMIGITYFREPLTLFKIASLHAGHSRGGGSIARSAPDQLTKSPSPATIVLWMVLSARATARSGLPCSSACFCSWR
jgi:small multidrug resistance pump